MADLEAIQGIVLIPARFDILRFPFFALNTKLRAQAQAQAKLFIQTHPGAADLTVEELRERLNSNAKASFINSIQRSINWIPGLTPFWQRQRSQLIQMIEQQGSPHLFFTLSAADLHWPDLHRLIENQRAIANGGEPLDISTLGERARHDRCVDNLTKYPHIVASFLQCRVKVFLDTLNKLSGFQFVDHWYRYEWQHRGSGHVHGFLWLMDGPNLQEKDLENAEHRQQLADYFSQKVFSHAPIPNLPRPDTNPCQLPRPANKDNRTDVTELLNRCQRHSKCIATYCLRYNKRRKALLCRFSFPQPVCDRPKIEKNEKGQWKFFPQRSQADVDLNHYHPLWIALWRGNIDVSPVLSKDAAVNYISKYAAKAESMSSELDKIILELAKDASGNDGIQMIVTKTLNRFVVERDFSAQEACHQLLHMQMVGCSRTFESINLPVDLTVTRVLKARSRRRAGVPADGGIQQAQRNACSKLESYMKRQPDLNDISYFDMVKRYQWNTKAHRWDPRRREAVVLIYPKKWSDALRRDRSEENDGYDRPTFSTAARRALMLYVPFRNLDEVSDYHQFLDPPLPPEPYNPQENNDQRWRTCLFHRMIRTPQLFPNEIHRLFHGIEEDDFDLNIDPFETTDEEWDPTPATLRRQEQEWETAGRVMANQMLGQPRDFFGARDIDLLHDWSLDLSDYNLPANLESFITTQKQLCRETMDYEPVLPHMLNVGQRVVYDYVVKRFSNALDGNGDMPENVIVIGRGGVGKSFLIRAMERGIWEAVIEKYGREEYPTIRTTVKLAAFTGKAAFQVGGVTIHSLLNITKLDNIQPLQVEPVRQLQRDLKNTRFLFLDEMSMIGLRLLYAIDNRLRQIFPLHHDKPFGGLIVVLFGDFGQLPPVMDSPLYTMISDESDPLLRHAFRLYRNSFTRAFELLEQMRQQGVTDMDLRFQTALSHLRSGEVQRSDWEFLQTRVLAQVPPDERIMFDNAVFLFSTNKEVDERNVQMLEKLGTPVARIEADYHGISKEEGAKIDSDYCNNLEHVLHLSVGCRVILRSLPNLTVGNANEKCMAIERPLQRRIGQCQGNCFQRRCEATESANMCSR